MCKHVCNIYAMHVCNAWVHMCVCAMHMLGMWHVCNLGLGKPVKVCHTQWVAPSKAVVPPDIPVNE